MKGSLAERAPCDVLGDVRRRQESGILRFEQGSWARQLFIDAGIIVRFAASNVTGESITALFKEKGGVTDDLLRQATAAKQPEELLGTTLARLGFLTRSLLTELTNEHIRRVLRGALDMRQGGYEFQQGALPLREQLDGGTSISELLLAWSRGLTDVSWIESRFGSQDVPVEMARRPPEGYQKIPLTPAEGYTMSRVDGRATIREICMVSPMGEEVALRALFGLALAGILEMPAGSAAQPPEPPAAMPPRTPAPARPAAPAAPARTSPASAAPATAVAAGAPAPEGSVLGGRAPGNGGAPQAAAPAPAPQRPPAQRPHGASARPATGKPGAARHGASGPHRAGATPRRVTGAVERVRPATPPDLEAEMLQRFEQMRQQDLYQVLGTPPAGSSDDIRRAYYVLAKKFHPDKFTREEMKAKAEKAFGHITEAYSTLSHVASRQKYDEDLVSRQRPQTQEKTDSGDIARQNFKHGKDLLDRGRFGEAVSFLLNAVEQDPARAEYAFHLALAQSKNPRWKKDAEESFMKALSIDPTHADSYAHLGALYARGGVQSKAREMYRKALEWDPGHTLALEGLAALEDGKKGLLGMFKK